MGKHRKHKKSSKRSREDRKRSREDRKRSREDRKKRRKDRKKRRKHALMSYRQIRRERRRRRREHNFDLISHMPRTLTEPIEKDLFMASLGMIKTSTVNNIIEDESAKRQTRQARKQRDIEDQDQPIGIIHSRLLKMQARVVETFQLFKRQHRRQRLLRKMLKSGKYFANTENNGWPPQM